MALQTQNPTFLGREFAAAFKKNDFETAIRLAAAGADIYGSIFPEGDALDFVLSIGGTVHIHFLTGAIGYDVNRRDAAGVTPLFKTILRGNYDQFLAVLRAKADVNAVVESPKLPFGAGWLKHNYGNMTPLMLACYLGDKKRIKKLLAKKADPNSRDAEGYTPLMYLGMRKMACQRVLLDMNIYIDEAGDVVFPGVEEDEGMREEQAVSIAELLISKGADPRLQNKSGKTAANLTPSLVLKKFLKKSYEK